MKVIEIRNLCVSYDSRICKQAADWAGLYIIKQILRNIQIKMLKNATNEVELWIPENIVKTIDNWFEGSRKDKSKRSDSRRSRR